MPRRISLRLRSRALVRFGNTGEETVEVTSQKQSISIPLDVSFNVSEVHERYANPLCWERASFLLSELLAFRFHSPRLSRCVEFDRVEMRETKMSIAERDGLAR